MNESPLNATKPWSLIKTSTLMYSLMAVIGLSIMEYGHDSLSIAFNFQWTATEWQHIALRGLTCGAALLCLSWYFEQSFESFQQLKDLVKNLLGQAPVPAALYLALISAVGEEILFRGALQPALGLWVTSALFGLMHIGPNGRISSWSIWAFGAGLVIGWMYQESGELWSAMLAHFVVNATSLVRLRLAFINQQSSRITATKHSEDEDV
jgi:membrane protease YdiL (CAAX protease family)